MAEKTKSASSGLLHICFIGEFPKQGKAIGGISVFMKTMADALAASGHQITVISFNEQKDGPEEGHPYPVFRMHPKKWRFLNFLRIAKVQNRLIREAHINRPIDVVETSESGLCFLKKIPGIRYVVRLHGGHRFFAKHLNKPINWWEDLQERISLGKADAIVGVSRFVLQETEPVIPQRTPRTVIYNPVNTTLFHPASIPQRGRNLVFVGWLTEKKGIRQLVEAFKTVVSRFPDVHLQVYGEDTFDREGSSFRGRLEAMVKEKAIPQVHFRGPIPNSSLPAVIADALCCIYPSHMEAMPLAWLEVMASGQVLIGGNTGPGPEIISDGENGLLCNPFDPDHIAEKIIWVLEHPHLLDGIRTKAREKALAFFSLEAALEANIRFWQGRLP